MIKSIRTIMKQDKEKYKVPRRVQDIIPITCLWEDGIFKVGSKYSKSFKFSDINYMVASRKDKESMFLTYSELLNSLDSGATTKITINNHHMKEADFEQSILMPMQGDENDVYRREYNDMLLSKATGANGVVQEKYITITVAKRSIEDTGTGQTMRQAVQEINAEYQQKLDQIKAGVDYDELEMSGSRAVWPEVLSVYAVRTTTSDNPQEVATMTPEKRDILSEIFWEMNSIDYRTETKTENVIHESDDGHGNILEEVVEETRKWLYITVQHKTATEMAAEYGFNRSQNVQLSELLDCDRSMWSAVLYGIYADNEQIVAVALSQLGNSGDTYWSWYGFSNRVEWCACFVSWCANECGYIENGICPKYSWCDSGILWFKEHSQWLDGSAEPSPGMIVFFDWNMPGSPQDGVADHTGIVEYVENGYVHTVEGNAGDRCNRAVYAIGNYQIMGYGWIVP